MNYESVASTLREYAGEHGISSAQVLEIFHAGIVAVAEKYPVDHELRKAVMIGSVPVKVGELSDEQMARSKAATEAWLRTSPLGAKGL